MPWDDRESRVVEFVVDEMQVGATHAAGMDGDADLVRARRFDGDLVEA